jgi:glycosyltransferase involved in cell wall biosynthesis
MMHCEEIDLVEFPEWGAEGLVSLLKPCRRVPMVVRLHTSLQIVARSNGQTPRGSPTFWLNTRFEGLCARRASALFSPSRALAVASARDMGFDPGRVHVVPAPVDADMFTPGPAPADSAQRPVILYVGRIEWRKGVQLFPRILAEVVQRFPGAILELIGADTDTAPSGGSMREYLLNAVPPGLRQHLVFRGAVPRQDLISHYRRSAVCVFPSVFENFPNTCLEAMACGRPVVGTRSGGMEEMIESGRSGLLMPPENPGQLGAAILSVLANREWGESLGQAARRRVETAYTRATVSRVMAQCFESIITHTPCRPHGL